MISGFKARAAARGAYAIASVLAVLLSGITGISAAAIGLALERSAISEKTAEVVSGGVNSEDHGPRAPGLAIVIDDCGADMRLARRIVSLDIPVTCAIIPNLKYAEDTAELFEENGIPYLVHVPMQALSDPDGKSGDRRYYYIGSGMSEREVKDALEPLLDSLKGAFGVNNHRGSKATSDPELMGYVMDVLAERDMFFLDSRTSPRSVAYDAAAKRGLASAENSFFLDNESDREKISSAAAGAIRTVQKKGSAVAICHLRPETVFFLEDFSREVSQGRHESGVDLITLTRWAEYAKGETR
ncbi:MAG: divergent polysaccharide deacetylase family protein [Synergistaceae bacterium]|nr:divergent polysaccharide deacetylase family protein [Synergistaceae bacterium]